MTYVYILRCADSSSYVGHTSDPDARKRAHDEGTASNHTAKRRPLETVYVEACASLADAVHRERQLKRLSRAKREALIAGDTDALHALESTPQIARALRLPPLASTEFHQAGE